MSRSFGFTAADERAKDKIEEEYAIAAAGVAELDYRQSLQANAGGAQVVSPIDLEKKKLDWTRAKLQTAKARKDQRLARLDADVKNAELAAAQIALDRRIVTAPFDGEVQLVYSHESEWVNPGDPILRLVQFDVMHVDCMAPASEFDPGGAAGPPRDRDRPTGAQAAGGRPRPRGVRQPSDR